MPSKGYTSSARMSPAPGAYYECPKSSFGLLGGAAPVIADVGSGGSLAATNVFAQVTWVTAAGESLPSAEGTHSIGGSGSDSATVTQPTVPTNGGTVLGWRLYAGATTGSEKLVVSTAQVTQAQVSFTTTQGVIANVFPVATTSLTVKVLPTTGAGVPTVGASGAQIPFPSLLANTSADYDFVVPNSGSQWKVQKAVDFMKPDGTAETAGIVLSGMDCISPLYPAGSATPSLGAYAVMNGYLFQCTVSGAVAATFPGFAAFSLAVGGTTVDGSATWTCLGRAVLVRAHFANVSGSAAVPAAQEYDLFQF